MSGEKQKTNILIVGAGKGGTALINLFHKRETINILAVIDIKDDAPGIKLAKKLGIPTATDYKEFLDKKELDEIINVTGKQVVQEELLKRRPANVEVMGGHSAKLMWSLIEKSEEAEKALRESEGRLKKVLDSIQAGVVVIEEETHAILDVNAVVAKMIGLPKEKIVGQVCHKFICPAEEGRCPITDLGQSVDKSERVLINAKGETIPILKSVTPLMLGGRRCLIESFLDIAKRKQIEKKLQEAYIRLKSAQSQLVQAAKMEAVGKLASGVAHEVKNPLAIILQGIDYLSEKKQLRDKNVLSVLKDMTDALRSADSVIKGLLDFSSLSEVNMVPENLNSVLDTSLLLMKHQFDRRHIQVTRDLKNDIPAVRIDKNRIEQVFINLFSNAIYAMPHGGTLTVRTYAKKLERETAVITEIEDTGEGIPEDILDKIFDPFFTTKRIEGGTGLGLTIVRNIVQMHKGKIEINNKEGGGVRVTVIFET